MQMGAKLSSSFLYRNNIKMSHVNQSPVFIMVADKTRAKMLSGFSLQKPTATLTITMHEVSNNNVKIR